MRLTDEHRVLRMIGVEHAELERGLVRMERDLRLPRVGRERVSVEREGHEVTAEVASNTVY